MSEQELVEAGFEKKVVLKEESGDTTDYYYYYLDLGIITFTSFDNTQIKILSKGKEWIVYPNDDPSLRIKDIDDVNEMKILKMKWRQ
jgi:hypothetical protein